MKMQQQHLKVAPESRQCPPDGPNSATLWPMFGFRRLEARVDSAYRNIVVTLDRFLA